MSLNAATVAVLIAKGMNAVDILDVARAMECRADATANERQKRCRANKKANGHAVTVTRDDVSPIDNTLTPSSPDPMISNEITPPAENDDQPDVKPEHVLEAWNAMAVRAGLPTARMTPERRKKLLTFVRRNPVDDITEAISAVECSPFCRGENDRSWKANLDFLLKPAKFTALLEGTYGR
jgi:hypothetical protein